MASFEGTPPDGEYAVTALMDGKRVELGEYTVAQLTAAYPALIAVYDDVDLEPLEVT